MVSYISTIALHAQSLWLLQTKLSDPWESLQLSKHNLWLTQQTIDKGIIKEFSQRLKQQELQDKRANQNTGLEEVYGYSDPYETSVHLITPPGTWRKFWKEPWCIELLWLTQSCLVDVTWRGNVLEHRSASHQLGFCNRSVIVYVLVEISSYWFTVPPISTTVLNVYDT